MTKHNTLIWLDMEMTGLCPVTDRILEVGMLITDHDLNILAKAPSWVLHQTDVVLEVMDTWNTQTHQKSGLIDQVKASVLTEQAVEHAMVDFMKQYAAPQSSPMCGNTVHQDRRFLAQWMPQAEAYFHYRNIDVSTLKELAKRWKPAIVKQFVKVSKHEALADIIESVEEMRYYREHFIQH
ncbi:MAG: oligoribonuclease [Neisseriales bacterium]|nr:MAG: oligoribonuclease [Neisseriales bacterium]